MVKVKAKVKTLKPMLHFEPLGWLQGHQNLHESFSLVVRQGAVHVSKTLPSARERVLGVRLGNRLDVVCVEVERLWVKDVKMVKVQAGY